MAMQLDEQGSATSRWRRVADFVLDWGGLCLSPFGFLVMFLAILSELFFRPGAAIRVVELTFMVLGLLLFVVFAYRTMKREARRDPAVRRQVEWTLRSWGFRMFTIGAIITLPPMFLSAIAAAATDANLDFKSAIATFIIGAIMFGQILIFVGLLTFLVELGFAWADL
jgi:hypothetical protein